jgi:hypothetical protein
MVRVGIVIAFTLYLSFGFFLIFPTFAAPRVFGKLAIGLCASELVASILWVVAKPGTEMADMAAGAAGIQIPVLTVATIVISIAYGLHIARRW